MKFKIKSCLIANQEHKRSSRQYAHTGHRQKTICIAPSFLQLPSNHQVAILVHEVGHLVIEGGSEREANKIAQEIFRVPIYYALDTPWGRDLQFIPSEDLSRVFRMLKVWIDEASISLFQPPQLLS